MRPAESRTHLGRFVQSVADGDMFDVVGRKLSTNIRLLSASTHRWVVLAALLLFFLCLIHLVRVPKNPDDAGGALSRTDRALSYAGGVSSREGGVSSHAGGVLSYAADRAEAGASASVKAETSTVDAHRSAERAGATHEGGGAAPDGGGATHEGGGIKHRQTGTLAEDAIDARSKLRRAVAWCHMWAELVWLRLREWARRTRIRAEESWSLRPLEGRTFEGLRLGLISLGMCMALAFGLNDSGIVLPGMAAILVIPGIALAAVKDREGGRSEGEGNEPTEA